MNIDSTFLHARSHSGGFTSSLCLDHRSLSQMLIERENILIIQDLDGVCMGLVKDPLTRVMDVNYLTAAKSLGNHFYVLTNGEHIGKRGVNGIVERAFADDLRVKQEGLYLQGLAAGGVQWQDCYGNVTHPGVSAAELDFLATVPQEVIVCLKTLGEQLKYGLNQTQLEVCIEAAVLDNFVSPTVNINVFYEMFRDFPQLYADLQQEMELLMTRLLQGSQVQGLVDSFFVHYAPNLGRDDQGKEIMQPAKGVDPGTTDFQFMLQGAIKEVGVVVILNHYYFLQTGTYPLGSDFNARQAPRQAQELIKLVEDNFDASLMPTIVGVGDTVTSKGVDHQGKLEFKRGGSDRGFLELIQTLGKRFNTGNITIYVDSSDGEVKNRQPLKLDKSNPQKVKVIHGPGDYRDDCDPLTLNFVFPGGHQEYIDFFCFVAQQRQF